MTDKEVIGILKISKYQMIGAKELKTLRKTLVHIPNLKPGDKVRFKKDMDYTITPEVGEIAEVFRVLEDKRIRNDNREDDFTILIRADNGKILEFALDSRFFERV